MRFFGGLLAPLFLSNPFVIKQTIYCCRSLWMKLTKSRLQQIIKEELNATLYEETDQTTKKAIETGKDMIGTPVGDVAFRALDKDPEFQEALEQAMSQMNEYGSEGPGNVGGQSAMAGGVLGAATAAPAMQTAFWGGVLSKSLAPAALGILKAIGLGTGAAGLGAIAGYLIYKGLMKVSDLQKGET